MALFKTKLLIFYHLSVILTKIYHFHVPIMHLNHVIDSDQILSIILNFVTIFIISKYNGVLNFYHFIVFFQSVNFLPSECYFKMGISSLY